MQYQGSSISNKRILLAEDCEDSREILKFLFTKSGAKVEAVSNGGECVSTALKAMRDHNPFDIIVLDLHMPGVDGNTATKQLRAEGYNLPIVAMTGQVSAEEERRSISAGCNAFMSKLSSKDNMLTVLGDLLVHESIETDLPALPFIPELIYSEPEYAPLIIKFIDSIDSKLFQISTSINEERWQEAMELCSSLSSGALYGYRIFAEHLSDLQKAIEDRNEEEITHHFRMLKQATRSIRLGRKEIEKVFKTS